MEVTAIIILNMTKSYLEYRLQIIIAFYFDALSSLKLDVAKERLPVLW